jgi:TolB-like protein
LSLFNELKRRNVFRVAIAYVISAWLVLQIADVILNNTEAPGWVFQVIMLLLGIGFFFALFFAWAFELTPEGIKREAEVDRTQSITPKTGRKLDFTIIGIMAVALAWFALDKFGSDNQPTPVATETTTAETSLSDGVATPSAKSVAVLPFLALTSGADDEYFADGLTEEILNALAQLPELLVTARTSAFQFKGDDIPPLNEIAATLGVDHIVEGSIRHAGDRIRVTAQLIRARDGFHLWSQNYDSTSKDTIQVQEDIAEQIAVAMDVVLDESKRESMRRAGLRDVEAFTAYQKGIDLYEKAHGSLDQIVFLRQANRYFDEVIEKVPGYADAYIKRSDMYTHILNGISNDEPMEGVTEQEKEQALANAIKNFRLAIENAGNADIRRNSELDIAILTGDWRGIQVAIDQQLAKSGCFEPIWLQPFATVFGFADAQKRRLTEIRRCDPLRSSNWVAEVRNLYWGADPQAALEVAKQAMEIAPSNWLMTAAIRAHIILGQFAEAEHIIETKLQNPDSVIANKVLVATALGDNDLTTKLLNEYISDAPRVGAHAGNFFLLNMNARAGNRDEANRIAAGVDKDQTGYFTLMLQTYWCACGEPFDLEYTPNFAAKLEESGLPWPPPEIINFPLKDW